MARLLFLIVRVPRVGAYRSLHFITTVTTVLLVSSLLPPLFHARVFLITVKYKRLYVLVCSAFTYRRFSHLVPPGRHSYGISCVTDMKERTEKALDCFILVLSMLKTKKYGIQDLMYTGLMKDE